MPSKPTSYPAYSAAGASSAGAASSAAGASSAGAASTAPAPPFSASWFITRAKFAKTANALEIKGGVVEGIAYDAKGIGAIAAIPSREELLSKLLGSIQSPITNFARVMNQLAEKGGASECEAPAKEEAAAQEAPVAEAPAAEASAEEAPAETPAE